MFYDIYVELSKQRGISPSKAADEIGINRATVTNWKKKGATPSGETLAKIAEYFNVTVDCLLREGRDSAEEEETKESPQPQAGSDLESLSKEEREVLTLYRAANPSLQAVVLAALEAQGQEK